jgi:hypothetical protein
LSRNPGALTSRTPQGHVGLFRCYFTFTTTTTTTTNNNNNNNNNKYTVWVERRIVEC